MGLSSILDLFITPLHIPHHEPGSGERVIGSVREGTMENFDGDMFKGCHQTSDPA